MDTLLNENFKKFSKKLCQFRIMVVLINFLISFENKIELKMMGYKIFLNLFYFFKFFVLLSK
ncbi:hypothetical protein CCUN_0599 [Campylobacter cuniculorum DSM 23162 = LMG 24588]|uniref:Uncharacterized protein n=1 Tax=Campylobacter cuniculorum DSM 23162 = LMG 24588 TaxID=1121267 RepID=A0A1W6BVY2_9BACT|nr:hypothetical protein CCUN_0599 [Campylobacter cuniculorum DSM 23162 = LMG 24588]